MHHSLKTAGVMVYRHDEVMFYHTAAFKTGRVMRWACPNWGGLRRPGSSWKQTLSVRGTGHGGSAVGFEDGGGHTVREVHGLWEQPPNDSQEGNRDLSPTAARN